MKKRVHLKIEQLVKSPMLTAVASFVLMAVVMLAYEVVMSVVTGHTVTLSDHLITVLFSAAVSFCLTLVLANLAAKFYAEYETIEDSNELHKAGMTAALHYLGNAVTTFQLIELEIEINGAVSENTLHAVRKTIKGTSTALKELSAMENPSSEKIHNFLKADLGKS